MNKKTFVLCLFVSLVFACTAYLPPVDERHKPTQPGATDVLPAPEGNSTIMELFGKTPKKDEELFNQGLRQVAEQAIKQGESGPARQTFETLLSTYPESKTRDVARALLSLLEEVDAYRNKLLAEHTASNKLLKDKTKIIQENEQLKKDLRLLNEKYQADLAALQQENEQLKKDIQQLKNLEIQLDRREKQLR